MNEQIRGLAKQAGMLDFSNSIGERYQVTEIDIEEFAELIVRECMSINTQRLFSDYKGDTHRVAHNNALWCACGDMQEHFGVEE